MWARSAGQSGRVVAVVVVGNVAAAADAGFFRIYHYKSSQIFSGVYGFAVEVLRAKNTNTGMWVLSRTSRALPDLHHLTCHSHHPTPCPPATEMALMRSAADGVVRLPVPQSGNTS